MFKKNWDYSESRIDQVKMILQSHAMHIVSIDVATPDADMKQSTDLVVAVKAGSVAVRIRRPYQHYRDLTIRAYCGGKKTEVHKIREGFCKWYLYAWEGKGGILSEWILVDIDKMRSSGLVYQDKKIKMNKDGYTGFINYSLQELSNIDAIVARNGV
ncbi:MAG: hypothetical protein GY755_19960 [Chloroflexi bacterium]|nr:hypothetical protein [Chloroflexota bacterium]